MSKCILLGGFEKLIKKKTVIKKLVCKLFALHAMFWVAIY